MLLKRVGKLTQAAEELPFVPLRAYWINTEGEARGGHAHYKTKQVFMCVKGYYTLVVDNGFKVIEYELSEKKPQGVYLTTQWHTMEKCSRDCIILVLASQFCDEADYIREYKVWKKWIKTQK